MKILCFLTIMFLLPTSNLFSGWNKISLGFNERMVRSIAANGNHYFAATVNGVHYSSNYGSEWKKLSGGIYNSNIYAVATSGNYVYAGTFGAGLYYSTNNGENWTNADLIGDAFDVQTIAVSENKVAAGCVVGVSLSEDHGLTWTEIGLKGWDISSLTFYNNTLIAGTFNHGVHIYTGSEWKDANNGLSINKILSISAGNNTIWVGTYGGGIFKSTDNGLNWSSSNNGIEDLIIQSIAVTGKMVFAGTKTKGIFFSNDGGTSWKKANDGLSNLSVLSFLIQGTKIIAGTAEKGIFTADLSEFEPNSVIDGIEFNKLIKSCYYNSNQINIELNNLYTDEIEIELYDINGYPVMKESNNNLHPYNNYNFLIETYNYSNGTYFLKARVKEKTEIVKINIIKY